MRMPSPDETTHQESPRYIGTNRPVGLLTASDFERPEDRQARIDREQQEHAQEASVVDDWLAYVESQNLPNSSSSGSSDSQQRQTNLQGRFAMYSYYRRY